MDLKSLFTNLPGSNVLVLPDAPKFTIVAVSNDYLLATGRTIQQLMGKGLFEAFPNNPQDPEQVSEKTVRASLEYALRHKESHQLPIQRYDVTTPDGRFEERFWSASNKPILNDNGEVIYLIHTASDVTEKLLEAQKQESLKGIQKAYNLFMGAPVIIGILKGDDYIIELANEGLLEVWDRKSDVVGQPLLKAIPELAEQGLIQLLDEVRTSGEPFYAYEFPITLRRNGKPEILYFDFVYKPLYEDGAQKASGIVSVGHDVTAQVLARRKEEESERKYRTLFESMNQGFCVIEILFDAVHKPVDYRFLEVNPVFESQTGLKDAVGKRVLELVPHIESQFIMLYGNVALTGKPIRFIEESKAMQRWFEVNAFPTGEAQSHKVAILFTDVTERKKAEALLHQSKERLQKVLSIETVGVIYFDLDGSISDSNTAFQRMSGYGAADFRNGKVRWDKMTPPEFMEVTLKSRQEYIERGQNTPYEKQYIRPDGSRWWGLFAGKQLSEREYVEFVVDITASKNAAYALQESESNLRNMIVQSPVAMCIINGPRFIVDVANSRMFELWGKGPEQLLHKPIFEGLPEAGDQGLEQLLQQVYNTGETVASNERPVSLPRNGTLQTAYLNFVYQPLKSGDGSISGIMAVAVDVTDQVTARLKLEDSNKELQFAMNAMPQMVWVTKPDGFHDFFNNQWYAYTGLTYEETKGTGWNKVVHPEDQQRAWEVWRRSLQTGDPYEIEYRMKRYDGNYYWFLGRALPLKDERGAILKWFGTCTNIDDQKKTEEVLEQRVKERTRELERRNMELEQFAHVSHHDLQEPLRKILMFTDMVKADSYDKLSEAAQIRLDKVSGAARRMSIALKDVLNFASLNKEEQAELTDLDDVLATVQMDLELVISEKDARIHSDALPTIKAIPQQMHQLLYNLLNNGLKFSKPGVQPVVKVSCRNVEQVEMINHPELDQHNKYYQIAVEDNGIGFEQAAADKIFGMFQRLHSKEAYAGTGIGLALCRKVVLNHGGKIWAESKMGDGATFHVLLPVE